MLAHQTRPLTLPSASPEGGLIVDFTQPRPQTPMRGPKKICKRPECRTTAHARGLCEKHYAAWRKATPIEERRLSPADRFWAKVDKSGPVPVHAPELGPCWIWTKATTKWGYGKLTVNNVWYLAHRRSYEMAHGSIPESLLVCHRCDTPACVRPAHLFAGTAAQNTRDMHEKGRASGEGAPGEQNGNHKLWEAQVIAIRTRFGQGELIRHLAVEYGMTVGAISKIVNGRSWKHIGGPIREPGQIGRRPGKVA